MGIVYRWMSGRGGGKGAWRVAGGWKVREGKVGEEKAGEEKEGEKQRKYINTLEYQVRVQ